MGLFDKLFGKKAEKDKKPASGGDPLDKLENGKIPVDWYWARRDFTSAWDKKLYELSDRVREAKSIDEEIELLKAEIAFYYEYQNECKSRGECYFKYFSDMHMHCHNSRNPDFEYIASSEARLKYLQENYDKAVKEAKEEKEREERKQNLLVSINLEGELEKILKADPGILQSEVYKLFDSLLKDEVSKTLYYLAKDGKISREKSGRSYKLFWL